jgi:hypothetical protein
MPVCADCGKPIEPGAPMYLTTDPPSVAVKHFHSGCGDPWGVKGAVAAERERCAKIVEDMDSYAVSGRGVYKRHPRTRAMLKKIAEAIRKG